MLYVTWNIELNPPLSLSGNWWFCKISTSRFKRNVFLNFIISKFYISKWRNFVSFGFSMLKNNASPQHLARARARARAPTVGPGSPGSLSASGASPLAFVESESPLFRARSRLVRTSKIFCWISYALALCVEECYVERKNDCFVKFSLQGVNLHLLETVRNSTLWGSMPKSGGFNSGYNLMVWFIWLFFGGRYGWVPGAPLFIEVKSLKYVE